MKNTSKRKVVMVSTESKVKPGELFIDIENGLSISNERNRAFTGQNLYFISEVDGDINVDDLFYNKDDNCLSIATGVNISSWTLEGDFKCCYKVTHTTDKNLDFHNIKLIPKSFVWKYIESNASIKYVDIDDVDNITPENTIHNMASCMLSILDSIKLYDNGYLDDNETLSEIMFRKMLAYDIDLNKELGFTHLSPLKKSDNKEKLILEVINDGKIDLEKTQSEYTEMISNYKDNGFDDMHIDNIESYKSGLSYTLGYTYGHLELLKKINGLIAMNTSEISDLISENKKISHENKIHLDDVLNKIRKSD